MTFCHLHSHDTFSFDGIGTPLEKAKLVASMGHPALAQTNHGTLSGSFHHIEACQEAGIVPIVGLEGYYRPNRHTRDKDLRYDYFHITLLAKDGRGWKNLLRLNYHAQACVGPETLVLTAALRWVPAGDLRAGDELLGFGEQPGDRILKKSIVEHNEPVVQPVYRIHFSDGSVVRAAEDHPWLTMFEGGPSIRWNTTKEIVEKIKVRGVEGFRTSWRGKPCLPRYINPWLQSESRDLGYLAGVFDGEGHFCADRGRSSAFSAYSQREGVVLDTTNRLLEEYGFGYSNRLKSPGLGGEVRQVQLQGGWQEQLRFLGQVRPHRLLEKMDSKLVAGELGNLRKQDVLEIEKIVFEGPQEVAGLQTSTGTYIAQGFGMHNSGFYQKPCLDAELLWEYGDGLICGLGCLGSWFSKCVARGDSTGARAWVRQLKRRFGDDLFGEIMPSTLPDQIERNLAVVSVCTEESVMVAGTVDSHSNDKESTATQDVRLMIGTGQTKAKREKAKAAGEEVFEFRDDTYYLQSEEEVRANFVAHHPGISPAQVDEAIRNTVVIASRVLPFNIGRQERLPRVERDNKSPKELLGRLAREGLERIGHADDPVYVERLEFELNTFAERDIESYFLMVWETVSWCRCSYGIDAVLDYATMTWRIGKSGKTKKPIPVGPGRGSAAGCLVSYVVGITGLDPMAYRLLFERFLNPNRKGLPDIDVDYPRNRIDEVEAFTKHRFGKDNVLDVIAHTKFGPRAAIGDVARVMSLPEPEYRKVTKTIDEQERGDLADIRRVNPMLDAYAKKYPDAYKHSCLLQGQVKGRSEHAAALLVTPPDTPVRDIIPIERIGGMKGKLITAWGESSGKGNDLISQLRLTKFDWLRVAELDKQDLAVDLIRETEGIDIDLDSLPIHQDPYAVDADVMEGFAKGLLTGVFQFSATAKMLTQRMRPTNVFDLAAVNALIRPGPRGEQSDLEYVARKNGSKGVTYWSPALEPHMDYTYGVLVFQEQLIEVVHHLGGLSRADADIFRKIASKLYRDPEYARETMGQWKEPILKGFEANGIAPELGEIIWRNLLSFSDYSFNLAHAAGYAVLAYRDMWLKVRYPRQFYAAYLSVGLSAIKELRIAQKSASVREARALGLRVLPPDINDSDTGYQVTADGIRIGLEAIQDIGGQVSKAILEHRPYTSYQDFEARVPRQRCNSRHKARLVCTGAFDKWGMRQDFTDERVDEMEREFLGLSVSSVYSADRYRDLLNERVWTWTQIEDAMDDTYVAIGGEVINVKDWIDRKGQPMAFVDLAFGAEEWSATIFHGLWVDVEDLVRSGKPIIITGFKNTYEGRVSVAANGVESVVDIAQHLELAAA